MDGVPSCLSKTETGTYFLATCLAVWNPEVQNKVIACDASIQASDKVAIAIVRHILASDERRSTVFNGDDIREYGGGLSVTRTDTIKERDTPFLQNKTTSYRQSPFTDPWLEGYPAFCNPGANITVPAKLSCKYICTRVGTLQRSITPEQLRI